MLFLLLTACHNGDICPSDSAPATVPVGALDLIASDGNTTLPNDATALASDQELIVTYTDEIGRTWRITYEIGEVDAWYHDY